MSWGRTLNDPARRVLAVRDRDDHGCKHPRLVRDANGDRWCEDCARPFDLGAIY